MSRNKHIPLKHYKVFLLQMCKEVVEKVGRTGLKRTSKRNHLVTQIVDLVSQLEREFKRDVTLRESASEKRDLYIELYDKGAIPSWLLDTLFHSLCEEQQKINTCKDDKRIAS